MSGIIAIVGRPNVGKSALFNRIVGRRIAIVHDQPGVTRDRISAEAEWKGKSFTLLDTGGIGLLRGEKANEVIVQAAFDQVELALESAHVIILVVNVQEGLVALDREVAQRLRKANKSVLVAVNKVDTPKAEEGMDEFSALGFEQLFPVTAIHGIGIEALMDAAVKRLPEVKGQIPDAGYPRPDSGTTPATSGIRHPASDIRDPASDILKIAIVGRPNVGKSSLINALTQSERVIVSPIPGTTRDSVDVPFDVVTEGIRQHYLLIDTAGLRKKRRVADSIEFFSVQRAEDSIMRADLAVLVMDAEAGITEQDKKIADSIVEHHKACVIVVSKWDLVADGVRQKREAEFRRPERRHAPRVLTTLGEFGRWVQEHLFFLDYAPVIFTSAKSGFQLDRLLEAIRYVAAQLRQTIPTSLLNRTLHEAVEVRQPVSSRGHRLKFFYATQIQQAPPTFLLFVNRSDLFTRAYRKYLANAVRRAFGYEGCPVILLPRERPKSIEPVRRSGGKRVTSKSRSSGHSS